jgi:elongator complex protein 2
VFQYPDFYFKPELHQQPPPEESLFQNTLWPELQKLYGHGYEIFCLASDKKGKVIASACKAAKTEHAQVI